MLFVLVIDDDGDDHHLIQIETTTDPTQARWDAYCYCSGDDSPQESTVLKYTRVIKPIIVSDPTACGRS